MAEDVDCDGRTRAARFRELAAALRALASRLKTSDASNELCAIANDYEVLAQHAERFPDAMDSVLEG
jgi:hypothetical protein